MGEELNNSYNRLQMFDLDGLENAEATQARWLDAVKEKLNYPAEFDLKGESEEIPRSDQASINSMARRSFRNYLCAEGV